MTTLLSAVEKLPYDNSEIPADVIVFENQLFQNSPLIDIHIDGIFDFNHRYGSIHRNAPPKEL